MDPFEGNRALPYLLRDVVMVVGAPSLDHQLAQQETNAVPELESAQHTGSRPCAAAELVTATSLGSAGIAYDVALGWFAAQLAEQLIAAAQHEVLTAELKTAQLQSDKRLRAADAAYSACRAPKKEKPPMSIIPERVAESVRTLVELIRHGASQAFAHHHAVQTVGYLRQVHDLGIINAALFEALVAAVEQAVENWQPRRDANGHLLDD